MSPAALIAGPVKGTPVLNALSEQRRQTGLGLSPSPMPRTVRFLGHPGPSPAGARATMLRRRAPGQGRPGLRGLQPQGGPKPALPPVRAPGRLTTPKGSTLPARRVSLPAGHSAASGSGCSASPTPSRTPPPQRRSRNRRTKRGRTGASALPRPQPPAARAEAEPRTPFPGSGGAGRGGATGGAGLQGSLATLRCGAWTRQGLRHQFTFQARP